MTSFDRLTTSQKQEIATSIAYDKGKQPEYVQTMVRRRDGGYDSLYPSMQAFLKKEAKYHRVTMSGLTHRRRDIVAIDVDEPYTDVMFNMLISAFSEYKIPHPNYLIINYEEKEIQSERKHWQAGWFLDEPFIAEGDWIGSEASNKFREVRKALEDFVKVLIPCCDTNFRGGYLKNPFCTVNQMCTVFFEEDTSRDLLCNSLLKASSRTKMEIRETCRQLITIKPALSRRPTTSSVSRNCYAYDEGCKYALQWMLKHGGESVPFNLMLHKVIDLETAVLPRSKYSSIEPFPVLKTLTYNIISFANAHFDKGLLEQSDDFRKRNEIRSVEKYLKLLRARELFSEGLKGKEVAEELGVTASRVSALKKESITDEEIQALLRNFYNCYRNDSYYRIQSELLWIKEMFNKKGWILDGSF